MQFNTGDAGDTLPQIVQSSAQIPRENDDVVEDKANPFTEEGELFGFFPSPDVEPAGAPDTTQQSSGF